MELFRSVLGAGAGSGAEGGGAAGSSSAETIERLVDRLSGATLLEDRRDACRALKAMSRKFRLEVGAQALDRMVEVLEADRQDEEIVGYALDCLCNVCSPDEFEEEVAPPEHHGGGGGVGEQFTEIYLKRPKNVQLVVDLLEEFDFRVRRPAVRLLTHLLLNKPREMQELILASQLGVSRLMDVLVDTREVLRNDALLLLIQLTKGNANLQKIVAFENCFDKLADIVETEGHSDGGIVVEDCLRLMLNLLRNNSSNQTFFREGSYIQRVAPFFDLTLDEEEVEVGWSAQKVANMMNMLLVVRTLVSPSNPTAVSTSCQSTVLSCGLLEKLCAILLAAGIPAEILTETIIAISELMRGHLPSQEFFSRVTAPSSPPRPALILLLMSMVNEKQPFSLRCAVLYCFQCYLHKNPAGQSAVMGTLLPDRQPRSPLATGAAAEPEVTAGQLLCGGLFAADRLSNWFSAVALSHGLAEQEDLKAEMLRVHLSTASGNEPVPLLLQVFAILQHTPHVQTRLGLLMLASAWAEGCTAAVAHVLEGSPTAVPFLMGQIGSNEHDELERLGQGLCAFLLGLFVLHNDDSVPKHSQDQLYQLIEKRIGFEVFMDKLSEVSKHEAYNKALKHPQIRSGESRDLVFDHRFCTAFKHLEHKVIIHLNQRRENTGDDASQNDPAIVRQYKEVIREQDDKIRERDQRIADLTSANLYLQGELGLAKQKSDELLGTIQTLKDLNSVLRAQQAGTPSSKSAAENNGPGLDNNVAEKKNAAPAANTGFSAAEKASLERELKIRDDIIQELEIRLSGMSPSKEGTPETAVKVNGDSKAGGEEDRPTQAELDLLQSQVQALQHALGQKDAELDRSEAALQQAAATHRQELEQVQAQSAQETAAKAADSSEQDDLLLLLANQDERLAAYRAKLQELGVPEDALD